MSKKTKAPAQEVPVVSGPCVYISYTVSRVSSLTRGDASTDCQNAPTCTVTLKSPTLHGPCTSEPCSLSNVESYQLNYSAESKHLLSNAHQDLPKLLNSPLVVEVSADGEVVAHAQLDLLPVASQASASVQARLNLIQSREEWPLAPNANITVAVTFTRDAPEVSGDGAAQEEQPSANDNVARELFTPFHFVDVSNLTESTVLALGPASATDLPSSFLSATAAVPSGLGVQLALIWRTGSSWVGSASSLGVCSGTAVAWDTAWRTFIKPADFAALKDAIEEGAEVFLEVARYLATPEEGVDAAFNNYHAMAKLPEASVQALKQPGCKRLAAAVQFDTTFNTAASTMGDSPPLSMLPSRPPDAPKAKPIEAAPPAKASGEESCAWGACKFQLDISLTNPVISEWQPPPKPNKSLHDILPKRSDQKLQGPSALGSYQSSLQGTRSSDTTVTFCLCANLFTKLKARQKPASNTEAQTSNSTIIRMAQRHNNASTVLEPTECTGIISRLMKEYASCDMDAQQVSGRRLKPHELRKKLIFELNRSGLYVDMKEKLRESMFSIAGERFDAETSAEIVPICSPLYAFMLDEIHASLNQAMGVQGKAAGHEDQGANMELAGIAAECEMQGDVARAKTLHEQRLTSDDSFGAWHEFAMFCMRQGEHERGEECFRQALLRDPTSLSALVALACICWFKGATLDVMFFEDAVALAHAAKDHNERRAMPWALLTMLLDTSCPADTKSAEVRNAQFKALNLASSDPDAASTLQAAPFLELEVLLLDLHLGSLALKVHTFALRQSNSEGFKLQLNLCKAQASALAGDAGTAVNMLKTAVRGTAPGSQERITASIVLGKTCQLAGNMKDAQEAFEAAIQCSPQNSPQEAYLQLGKLYMQQGLYEYAADVYTHACSSHPCGSSWLGLGLAYLRMGRLADADLVLAEAVTCDPQNAIPRSYLALIHILVENKGEACECLESAEKYGLSDPGIMQEIGEGFASKGMFHEAAAILRRALACSSQPSFSTLASLGEAHLSCYEIKAARAAWENARAVAAAGQETELADVALTNIKLLQGDQDENTEAVPTEEV